MVLLIVRGSGDVGAFLDIELVVAGYPNIRVAGRNEQKVRQTAASLGEHANWVSMDVKGAASVDAALDGVGRVVGCSDPREFHLRGAVAARGFCYVDITAGRCWSCARFFARISTDVPRSASPSKRSERSQHPAAGTTSPSPSTASSRICGTGATRSCPAACTRGHTGASFSCRTRTSAGSRVRAAARAGRRWALRPAARRSRPSARPCGSRAASPARDQPDAARWRRAALRRPPAVPPVD